MSEKNDKNNQDSEKINIKSDELKNRINSMMNLVEDDDDEIDNEFLEELNKPKKKKFFGLF